ncbi:MAG TPA: MMPL family transporter [Gaiellaceae bacterium]|nr:MMPL family transporter [Gaiellaceae bacterium]
MNSLTRHHDAGIAERLGRWSSEHRAKAILFWLTLLLVAIVAASGGAKLLSNAGESSGDSAKAERLLENSGFDQPAAEQVLLQVRGAGSIESAAGRAAAREVTAAVGATHRVTHVRNPFAAGNGGQISRDGRSALVLFSMKGKAKTADERVQPVLNAVDGVANAHPRLRIEEFGAASAAKALNDTVGKDFNRAERISIPLTFVILWLAFAALVAALLPVGLALSAIVIAGGLVALTSHALPIDADAKSMVLLIGLAVGVDYSLFYFRRAREERAGGVSNQQAVAVAAATSGKAVLTSGLTVVVAMTALFLTGLGTFMGMAEATALVVAVAMLGSLTVLPALLSKLGDRVDRGRIPFLGRWLERRRIGGESRVWAAIVRPALTYPLVTVVLAAGFLVLLAVPAVHLKTASPGVGDLPRNLGIIKTYDRIEHAFGANPVPAQVVVSAKDVRSRRVRSAIASLEREALASGQMHEPFTVDVNPGRTLARIGIPLVGDGTNAVSQNALHTLRSSIVAKTVGTVGTAYVTGPTARSVDFNHQLSSRTPYVFAFILGLAFLLLLWTFRSLVIPLTAIALNLLSVGAAYGVLVSVFQGGWGIVHLNGVQHGPIAAWLPLFLFVILFGLSMDYHVFILSRIREGHDEGLNTHQAIRSGITHSAGVITSAAIVMVAVFATFATLSVTSMKQLGVGLAVAIFLDATVVRGLLLPAVMTLLGERNWYLPRWLERLMTRRPHEAQPRPVAVPHGK